MVNEDELQNRLKTASESLDKVLGKLKSPRPQKDHRAKSQFLQLIGHEGEGCRRLAFHFLKKSQKAIWMRSQWKLYAPLLWKLAQEKDIRLLGLECPERKNFRKLWRELYESRFFDVWVLDGLQLREADGFFLKQLVRSIPVQILVIDAYPHSFCNKRAHISLSHHLYRIDWSKGGSKQPEYVPADYLEQIKEDLCLL